MGEPGDQELGDSTCETGRLGYPLIGSNTAARLHSSLEVSYCPPAKL